MFYLNYEEGHKAFSADNLDNYDGIMVENNDVN
jgi:hypothetical protein